VNIHRLVSQLTGHDVVELVTARVVVSAAVATGVFSYVRLAQIRREYLGNLSMLGVTRQSSLGAAGLPHVEFQRHAAARGLERRSAGLHVRALRNDAAASVTAAR
jgi:hypothetical protein